MQVAETKTSSSASLDVQAKRQPFFNKEGQGGFFSKSNESATSFFNPTTIQPKLTVGQPNDKYEVEADAMADRVVQRLSNPKPANDSSSEGVQKGFEEDAQHGNLVQTKCAECEKEEKLQKKEEPILNAISRVQCKPIFESDAEVPEGEAHRKAQQSQWDVPSGVLGQLNTSKGNGTLLEPKVQQSMGSGFGADFSGVHIHTGSHAIQMARDLNAQAFTHGRDIYFNQGKYDPGSASGKHLLAHELTHTVQQGAVKTGTPKTVQRREEAVTNEQRSLSSAIGTMIQQKSSTSRIHLKNGVATPMLAFAPPSTKAPVLQLKCDECEKEGKDEKLQKLQLKVAAAADDSTDNNIHHTPSDHPLLARQMRHTVQQGGVTKSSQNGSLQSRPISGNKGSDTPIKKSTWDESAKNTIQRLEFEDLKYASPLYWQYRGAKWVGSKAWQGAKSLSNPSPFFSTNVISKGNKYYDIRGKTSFSPDLFMWLYILSYFEKNRTNRVPIKIKYGGLGKGTVILEADDNYNFSTTGNYIIAIDHSALKVDTKQKALALEVNITKNGITGKIGVPRRQNGNEMKENPDMPFINFGGFNRGDLYPVILGEAYDGGNFQTILYENILMAGYIHYLIGGFLNIGHQQNIMSILVIEDNNSAWKGKLETQITGTEGYALAVDRTPGGLLSAQSSEMKLDGHWKGQGFTLDGGLHIVYSNKSIEMFGTAKYKSKRAEGSVTIAVLPEPKAQILFRKHLPLKNNKELPDAKKGTETDFIFDPLALTAWGNFHIKLIDKTKTLSGDATFAVSPEGYIVTAGQVKLQKDFIFMDALSKEYTLFEDEISTRLLILGVPVKLSLRGDIKAGYQIGPVVMYELFATGAYSNHPDYYSELCLGAKFEMPANLYVQVNMVAAGAIAAGYKFISITLVEVGGRLSGRADLNAYVNAIPSIGVRKEKDGEPEYCLLGKLSVGGNLVVSFDAGLEISVFRKIKTEEGREDKKSIGKKNSFGNWTLGNFGFAVDVDYTLGSDKKPDFAFSGEKFNEDAFKKALKKKTSTETDTKPKVEGGFEQEGAQKGIASDESIKDKEINEGGQPLGPFELVEHFDMNGTSHKLYLEIGGTEETPKIKLEMASERDDLTKKINEEIAALEKVNSSAWLIISGELTEDHQKKIEMRIARLERIKEKAVKVKSSVTTIVSDPKSPLDIAAPGFESLDDEINEFANQFGTNDLGEANVDHGQAPVHNINMDKPPEGMDIELVLPPQKAVHLGLYKSMLGQLQHSKGREERDTQQQTTWDNDIRTSMPRGTYCQGRGLGLTETDIYRPYWSKRYLDASRKSRKKPRDSTDIPRMQVDHVIEWQVRPLDGAPWLDQPWNFELMDASSNASSGPKMKGNINRERERLAALTGDDGWLTKDITFTIIKIEGSVQTERWGSEEIEDGDHHDAYRILAGEVIDDEKEKTC